MSNDLIPDPAANAALEHRRDVVRTRLFHAVEALDAKRKQIVEVGHRGKEVATISVLAGAAALVLAAVPILVYRGYRHFRRPSLNVRLARWIEPFRELWDARLDRLDEHLRRMQQADDGTTRARDPRGRTP